MFLECACIDIGTIHGDICLREPQIVAPERQQVFLRRADALSHRMWFLWDSEFNCGCCGGCQFLDGTICRDETLYSYQTCRYFSPNELSLPSDHVTMPMEPFPNFLSFDSLLSLEYLHQALVTYYGFISPPTLPLLSSHPASYESTPYTEITSQDSEGSFDTAKSSLPSASEESYASLENSPHLSQRNSQVNETEAATATIKQSETSPDGDTLPYVMVAAYSNVLDNYFFHWKSLKIMGKCTQIQSDEVTNVLSLPTYPSPRRSVLRGTPRKKVPGFVLEIPEISHSCVGQLPSVFCDVTEATSYPGRKNHLFPEKKDCDETLAYVSVNANILGNIGVLISPPAVTVVNK